MTVGNFLLASRQDRWRTHRCDIWRAAKMGGGRAGVVFGKLSRSRRFLMTQKRWGTCASEVISHTCAVQIHILLLLLLLLVWADLQW